MSTLETGLALDALEQAIWARLHGLYKTEPINRRGQGKGLDDVEYAALEWVDWFNHRRILEPIGDIPPAEYEANYYRQNIPAKTAWLKQTVSDEPGPAHS